jgi:hypothetical protein
LAGTIPARRVLAWLRVLGGAALAIFGGQRK